MATKLIVQALVQSNIKGKIEGLHYWPFMRGIYPWLVILWTKGHQCGKCFHCHHNIFPSNMHWFHSLHAILAHLLYIYVICQCSMQAPIASIFLYGSVMQHMYSMYLLPVSDLSCVLATLAIYRANTKNWPDRKPDINTWFILFALT